MLRFQIHSDIHLEKYPRRRVPACEPNLILAEDFFSENGSDQLCEGYTEVLGLGNGLSIIKQGRSDGL